MRRSEKQLTRRLAPLWHGLVVRVRVHPLQGRLAGDQYLVLPGPRRPVLLVPVDQPLASALSRTDLGQRSPWRGRALSFLVRGRALRFLPLPRVVTPPASTSPALVALFGLVPDARAIVIRLGRPRPGRAVVVQAVDVAGRAIAYAKVAEAAEGDQVRREHDNLRRVGSRPSAGLRAPEVLGFEEDGDQVVLVEEGLQADGAPEHQTVRVPVEAMAAFAASGDTRTTEVRDLPLVARLRSGLHTQPTWWRTCLDDLLASHGDTPLSAGRWHGDWVAWNMALDGSTVLLWDWEHFEEGVPLGFDHLHFTAQEARRRRGTDPAVEDDWVDEARRLLQQDWGHPRDLADVIVRLYLLSANARYVDERSSDPGAPDRVGWSRTLLERLGSPDGADGTHP